MLRKISLWLLVSAASVGVASCADQSAPPPSAGAARLGLDSSIDCPEGEVGWRFATELDPNSEEYTQRAGDSAVVEITRRYAVDIQSVTCAGEDAGEINSLRNECGGSLTCSYSPQCQQNFVVTYTCGVGDTDDNGTQNVYTATGSNGEAVDMACSQPAKEQISVETRTACVPRQCHGRARRNLDMECVENAAATEVAMRGGFGALVRNGTDYDHYNRWIFPDYAAQTDHNNDILTDESTDAYDKYYTQGELLYPGMPYEISLWMYFYYDLVPAHSSVVVWADDLYEKKTTGETVRGFRCVAFKKNIDPDNPDHVGDDATPRKIGVDFSGVISEACAKGGSVSEDNAAKMLGLSAKEFRQQYDYARSQLHASYDMEGHAALHKVDFNPDRVEAQELAYKTPECTPNPQDFYYDGDSDTYDLIGYYSQREFGTPKDVYFAGPDVARMATIMPGDIKARDDLTIRVMSQFNASLPIDLSWTAANLNQANWYNPWANNVDVGGAWQDGKSLPDANYAPTHVHASVFIYPMDYPSWNMRVYDYKIGEIPLDAPNPDGKTVSVNLPINARVKRYFTQQSSQAYVAGDSGLFRLFYCIESDQNPEHPQSAFKTRVGNWGRNGQAVNVGQVDTNYLITDDFRALPVDERNYMAYALRLDTEQAANSHAQIFGKTMRGCRMATQPLRVNIDRYVTPMEPIASTGFTGTTKTSQSGDDKMSGSADNDAEINCTGRAKDNCEQANNGGNRTKGASGRSNYDLNATLTRKPGDHASVGMTGEILGYQLINPNDPISQTISYPADSASASSTPVTMSLAPGWQGIADTLNAASGEGPLEWGTSTYGGQNGLGLGWEIKENFMIGPVPVQVSFAITVGASVSVNAEFQFAPGDDQKYPCIGSASCVEKVSQPATFDDAATYCNVRGGRLAQLNTQAEANALDSNRGGDDVWIGAQLAYRFPKPACATNFVSSECMSGSKTEFRWLSDSEAFARNDGTEAPTYEDTQIFNAFHSGLSTRYPHESAVVYKSDGTLQATDVNRTKPFLCAYDAAAKERYLRWQLGLNMGAGAGFNLTGCTPTDNPGFCLAASFNVVSLSIGPQYENTYHWLYRAGEDTPFSRRGNTNISVPWALNLFEGSVYAAVNFLWFSANWTIASYDGITAAEGKLYDADTPVIESLE